MDSATAQRLLDLNRRFYSERGREFAATRLRLQPGIKRLLERLDGGESILDLGCGNGTVARSLAQRGHRGPYVGLDSSPILLDQAQATSFAFPARFALADLSRPSWERLIQADRSGGSSLSMAKFDLILCLAVLHHMPGASLRSGILCCVHELMATDGTLILSNWRFRHSPRLTARIQPWSDLDLTADEVDAHDFLLDWRSGGRALRYVHEFDEPELTGMASAAGFDVIETFYSDGADRESSIYQIWRLGGG